MKSCKVVADENEKGSIEWAGMTHWIRRFGMDQRTVEQTRGRGDVSKCDEVCGDVIKYGEARYLTSRNDWWDTCCRKRERPKTEMAGMTNWVQWDQWNEMMLFTSCLL